MELHGSIPCIQNLTTCCAGASSNIVHRDNTAYNLATLNDYVYYDAGLDHSNIKKVDKTEK